jgi:hypothetical protein
VREPSEYRKKRTRLAETNEDENKIVMTLERQRCSENRRKDLGILDKMMKRI